MVYFVKEKKRCNCFQRKKKKKKEEGEEENKQK